MKGERPFPPVQGGGRSPICRKLAVVKNDSYKWDGDTRDERESEFTETNFSTTRGDASPSSWARDRARRKRKQRTGAVVWTVLIAFGLLGLAIFGVVRRMRG